MDLFKLREQFTKEGILMCFNGPFSHSIIEEIGIAIRNHLVADNIARMSVQDVFAVYIEMAQNARNYLAQRNISQADAGSATIVIAKRDEAYTVIAGNVILKSDVEELTGRIDYINSLDSDELKKMIRKQLRCEVPPGAVGAGIGLMEMAKRTTGRLQYTICDVDGQFSFFTLSVQL